MSTALWLALPSSPRWRRLAGALGREPFFIGDLRFPEGPAEGLLLAGSAALGSDPAGALAVLRRRAPQVAVVVLTSPGAAGEHLGALLFSGVRDVLPEDSPDHILEIRLRAHLRGLEGVRTRDGSIQRGGIRLDLTSRDVRISDRAGRWRLIPPLTPKEFLILRHLLGARGAAVPREALIEGVWPDGGERVNPEVLDKHVGSLRRKLGARRRRIRTVRGVGYRLA